jgi:hypothetical protein
MVSGTGIMACFLGGQTTPQVQEEKNVAVMRRHTGKQHYQHGLYPTNSQQAALHHLHP